MKNMPKYIPTRQPISTAPKTGKVVTVSTYTDDSYGMIGSAYYEKGKWYWREDYTECQPQPEYWLPQ